MRASLPRSRAFRLLYEILWNLSAAATLEATIFSSLGGKKVNGMEQYFEGVCRFAAVLRRQDRQDVKRKVVELGDAGVGWDSSSADTIAVPPLAEMVLLQLENH